MCAAVLAHSGWVSLPLPSLAFLYYSTLVGATLLAWRFHASRVLLAILALFLAYQGIGLPGAWNVSPSGWAIILTTAILVPVDLVFIALSEERGFTLSGIAPLAMFLAVQVLVVIVLAASSVSPPAARPHHWVAPAIPDYIWIIATVAALSLLLRTLMTKRPSDSAFLWVLAAFLLVIQFRGTPRISVTYAVVSFLVLATSVIETSYLLAYRDELTMLPSRRAFNDALLRLQQPYTMAVVDIDHFKKFNDTYGHEVGDQVLCLVAAKLARISGGGEAYRCGGEEFNILFPGKAQPDVVEHLEKLRSAIETAEFHVRGQERRQIPRGPDRRNAKGRARTRKGDAIRQLSQERSLPGLQVTVSIGIASSSPQMANPDRVLQAADQALYSAKANGRNRIEVAEPRRRRQAKSTGVA